MIEKLAKAAKENNFNVYRITEICGDKSTTEVITPSNDCNNVYSISKAITSTALGVLYDEGKISLDDNIYDFFADDYPELDDIWKSVTLHNVLTHTTGIAEPFLDVDAPVDIIETEGCDDYLKIALNRLPVKTPGTEWNYSDSNYYIISRVIEKVSGIELEQFLFKHFFRKMKFQSAGFAKCPYGHSMGATGLFLNTVDLAKFGKMCLDGGKWEGEQLISKQWLDISTSRQWDLPGDGFYGFGFSGSKNKTFTVSGGMYGQTLFFSRKHNYVVAYTCHDADGRIGLLTRIMEEAE